MTERCRPKPTAEVKRSPAIRRLLLAIGPTAALVGRPHRGELRFKKRPGGRCRGLPPLLGERRDSVSPTKRPPAKRRRGRENSGAATLPHGKYTPKPCGHQSEHSCFRL